MISILASSIYLKAMYYSSQSFAKSSTGACEPQSVWIVYESEWLHGAYIKNDRSYASSIIFFTSTIWHASPSSFTESFLSQCFWATMVYQLQICMYWYVLIFCWLQCYNLTATLYTGSIFLKMENWHPSSNGGRSWDASSKQLWMLCPKNIERHLGKMLNFWNALNFV